MNSTTDEVYSHNNNRDEIKFLNVHTVIKVVCILL